MPLSVSQRLSERRSSCKSNQSSVGGDYCSSAVMWEMSQSSSCQLARACKTAATKQSASNYTKCDAAQTTPCIPGTETGIPSEVTGKSTLRALRRTLRREQHIHIEQTTLCVYIFPQHDTGTADPLPPIQLPDHSARLTVTHLDSRLTCAPDLPTRLQEPHT